MSGPRRSELETVVIGGGVIGLSVAFELLRRGREVRVVERDRCGSGATQAAAGMIAPVSEAEAAEPAIVRFGQDSLGLYPELIGAIEEAAGRPCGYRTDGTLWAAINRDNREEIERLAETLRLKGLSATWLGPTEIIDLEPHFSPRMLGGLLVAQDLHVNSRALADCLERAVRAKGGSVVCGTNVAEIVARGGRVRALRGVGADGQPFEWEAEELVLAAGAWAEDEIRSPLSRIGLRPVKGQMLRLRGAPLIRHVVRTPDCYLVPHGGGELLVGATMEEMGFDARPTAGAVSDLLRYSRELLPGLDELELCEIAVGFRPVLADHLPLIGASGIEGLYVALGHYRHGLLLAAATAHYLARRIVEGDDPAELAPFLPAGRVALDPQALVGAQR